MRGGKGEWMHVSLVDKDRREEQRRGEGVVHRALALT